MSLNVLKKGENTSDLAIEYNVKKNIQLATLKMVNQYY